VLDEDPLLPRIYGPLLAHGMSLREIRSHNRFEIQTMLMALSRYNILQNGQGITEDMRKGSPRNVGLYNAYLNEVEKYAKKFGVENALDDTT
jgi:hypothetical protein